MNICFFTDMYNLGGGEKNLLELAKNLKKTGNCVTVFLPQQGQLSKELESNQIDYCFLGFGKINRRWILGVPIFIDLLKFMKIIQWNKKNKFYPDVVHCNAINSIPIGKMIAHFYDVKLIWTCHGPWEVPRRVKKFFIDNLVDKVVAITPEIFELIKNKKKILVPLGIECERIERKKVACVKVKKIICVARFQNIKGQDLLIKAFKIIKASMCNVELHFFGGTLADSREENDFLLYTKQLVKDLNLESSVFFHGFEPNIRNMMNQYDLLCIPSRYESFSITLLEGLNSGMFVVAPNTGGPKYILQNGINGVLFETGEYNDLAEKCIDVLSGKIVMDVENIVNRGMHFSIENQANSLIKIYKNL